MRAVRIHGYGGPEVMRLDQVPVPQAGEEDVLVRLAVASVNPIDWKMRHGLLGVPLPRVLGRDGSGIDARTGERLLGIGSFGRDGTHAEYAVFERHMTAPLPPAVSFEQAAAIGIAGLSAWIALVETAGLRPGQRVLVHAGAGGVGGFALQIARLQGAEAWTTCSPRHAEACLALGAARAIDYAREDFRSAGPIFDAVLDTIGGNVHAHSAEVLKPGGVLVYLNAAPPAAVARRDVLVRPVQVQATRERLLRLLQLGLHAPIGARFPLDQAAEAYELSRGGHAGGKIVVQVG